MKKININVRDVGISFLFLISLNYVATSVYGQRSSSIISGFVFDQQRTPVSQIPVELLNDVNSVVQRTKTDGSGRFLFNGLSAGRFQIRVLPLGTNFEEKTQEVELTGTGALGKPVSDMVQVDIYLRLRKSDSRDVTGAMFVQEVPEEAKKLYEKAVSDLEANKADTGIGNLENALKVFPTYYLALEKLGLVYINQQKYEPARDIFTKAVAINSRSFSGWYGLCYANYYLKQWDPAVEAAKKAVSLNSSSVEALLFLGISLRQTKQFEEAEKSLKQAEKLANGKVPDIHWNLALLYNYNLKRYKDAANELELYLKANPETPETENIKKIIKQLREKTQ